MNPNAIIIKAKSLEAQLMNHLRHNGGFRDYITDKLDRELAKCSIDLRNIHWTQETEELRQKWNKTKEEIDSIKKKRNNHKVETIWEELEEHWLLLI